MIHSEAPPEAIATIRHLAGPDPAGCRITRNERLHLIWQLSAIFSAMRADTFIGRGAFRALNDQLSERGLSPDELAAIIREHGTNEPVAVADVIAVHPSLASLD